ncbi:hypothetical protein THRCLA_08677 [Thraustotheca clavata]|uniref:Uncharacterized protein n=1 Tax=Thraustotheca clavata TaxID=74557 RepID=A0A1V9Z3R2_9STRA|nr:hypothetical protein THRCLA_08677 [Thraustotheca clavata]
MQGTLTIESIDHFRNLYQRNNKGSGHKNLKCFPNCCMGIHAHQGFCGSAVRVEFKWESSTYDFKPLIFAAFTPITNTNLPHWNSFQELPNEKDISWYKGDLIRLEKSGKMTFSVNSLLRAWHYGWQSNRHTAMTEHVLCIYAIIVKEAKIHVIDQIHSPRFRIFSRRRAKTTKYLQKVSTKPIMTPLLPSISDQVSWQHILDDTSFLIDECKSIASTKETTRKDEEKDN